MEGFDRSATGEKALTLARERRAAEMMRIVKMVVGLAKQKNKNGNKA